MDHDASSRGPVLSGLPRTPLTVRNPDSPAYVHGPHADRSAPSAADYLAAGDEATCRGCTAAAHAAADDNGAGHSAAAGGKVDSCQAAEALQRLLLLWQYTAVELLSLNGTSAPAQNSIQILTSQSQSRKTRSSQV